MKFNIRRRVRYYDPNLKKWLVGRVKTRVKEVFTSEDRKVVTNSYVVDFGTYERRIREDKLEKI